MCGETVRLIVIQIDGRDLREIVASYEPGRPRSRRDDADYECLHVQELHSSARAHFLGDYHSHLGSGPLDKTCLLCCGGCNMPMCWGLFTKIDVLENTVVWSSFEHNRRRAWDYPGLRLAFDRQQYESALAAISL
jgi:hypothetical protein